MSDGIHLTDYHNKVIEWLSTELEWLQSIDYYPEIEKTLTTPCAFFAVTDWDKSENQPMNGQLCVTLNCEILAVLGMAKDCYQLEVRNAAMAIALKVDQARFGMPVEPAFFTTATPDAFNPELDEYAVWSIRFSQDIHVGKDEFKPDGLVPTQIKVGVSPDIGAQNQDKYEAL